MFENQEYQERINRLQKNINEAGHDAFVVSTDTNVMYLIGLDFYSMERDVFLVVYADADPCLIVPRMEEESLGDSGFISNVKVYWEMEARQGRGSVELLDDALSGLKYVAIEPLAEASLTGLLHDYEWKVEHTLENMRVIKSPEEVDLIRRVSTYWTRSMNAMLDVSASGVTLGELMSAGSLIDDVLAAEKKANHLNTRFSMCFQCSPASASPHHFTFRPDEALPDGATVVFAVGSVGWYHSENERTILTGAYKQAHADMFDIATEAQQLALDMITPGLACADVDIAVQNFFEKKGVLDHIRHRVGHGIGMMGHERPYTSEGSPEVYQPNMVITVEPGLYVPGVGGFRHSDTLLITENGTENLTSGTPKDRESLTFK